MEEQKKLTTGTTTVGMVCKDGVVLAAEKKSTMGYLIASKEAQKIYQLDDAIAMTIAGSVGDAQTLIRYMKAELKLFSIQNQRRITVRGAVTLLSNILQGGRWSFVPYMVQLIVAGVDDKGPSVYSLDALGGFDEEKKFFSTGSGSPFALGVLEDSYKDNMVVEDGIRLAIRAIRAAVERDIGSGGRGVQVSVITSKGVRKLSEQEIADYK